MFIKGAPRLGLGYKGHSHGSDTIDSQSLVSYTVTHLEIQSGSWPGKMCCFIHLVTFSFLSPTRFLCCSICVLSPKNFLTNSFPQCPLKNLYFISLSIFSCLFWNRQDYFLKLCIPLELKIFFAALVVTTFRTLFSLLQSFCIAYSSVTFSVIAIYGPGHGKFCYAPSLRKKIG